ncbi:hypothetical protein DYB28_012912 [Aphanomyces astaci]|uniref:Uncharacterized protein n=1 Tax=Aphanomyces astaci TaxID=112090 RepID=A0A9X8H6U1_APHAT|nr:hypothetical protein DYB28_012912 [Aphanomyces astaci]
MFKRGVRHARAESCLEHTDRELNSIADCMKLLRAREVRLDEITGKLQTYAKPLLGLYVGVVSYNSLTLEQPVVSSVRHFGTVSAQPPLKQPRMGFLTADNSNLDILGRAKFSFHLAGANV